MNDIINIIVVIISTSIMLFACRRIINGNLCIIDFCIIIFYMMQIFPIIVEKIYGVDESLGKGTNYYKASIDENVTFLYAILMLCIMIALAIMSKLNFKKYTLNYVGIKQTLMVLKNSVIVQFVLSVMLFIPLILAIISPNPMRYLTYTSIWKINTVGSTFEKLYHNIVIYYGNNIALLAIIIKYFSKSKRTFLNCIDIILAIIIMTWIDGKRALFIMALLGILIVDIIGKTYEYNKMKFLKKIVITLSIIVIFFFLYGKMVGKLQDSSFITNYSLYFGRMSCVKVAIYDMLNNKEILEYPGQTILFNLFFYIPRAIWKDKPSMFTQYFTEYAINSVGFASWNLHVNIWTEMISNFGILLGILIALAFTHFVASISSKSRNLLSQITGLILLLFYYMFGFEIILMIVFVIWLLSLVISKFRIEDNTIKFIIHR